VDPLRVLLTNVTLASYTGTELYVFDLARRLLRLGHQPVVYTPEPGDIADRLRRATVPVVNDLAALGSWVPDVMHCHHTLETLLALLHFPTTPAVYVCHDGSVWFDEAPPHRRIVRHVAVDENCRDRLELVHGVPAEHIRLIPNWVDLGRFRPRPPLPAQPGRAVVFSNQATRVDTHLGSIQEACDRLGLPLDVIGFGTGTGTTSPEDLLGRYDLVFAKAKAALEAMAVGAAVVLCDTSGLGPMVTSHEFNRLRRLNFGARSLDGRIDPDAVAGEIKRYDAVDAALVSNRVRTEARLEPTVDRLVAVYREAIEEGAQLTPDPVGEGRVLATFLRPVSLRLRQAEGERGWLRELEAARAAWEAARHEADAERRRVEEAYRDLVTTHQEALSTKDALDAEVNDLRARSVELDRDLRARGAQLDGLRAQAEAYQLELNEVRRRAQERADEADDLRNHLEAMRATVTFRLRARLLGLPIVGRGLRLVVRLVRR
jgi:hypothetical protein